jgi:hypothetical protein
MFRRFLDYGLLTAWVHRQRLNEIFAGNGQVGFLPRARGRQGYSREGIQLLKMSA